MQPMVMAMRDITDRGLPLGIDVVGKFVDDYYGPNTSRPPSDGSGVARFHASMVDMNPFAVCRGTPGITVSWVYVTRATTHNMVQWLQSILYLEALLFKNNRTPR